MQLQNKSRGRVQNLQCTINSEINTVKDEKCLLKQIAVTIDPHRVQSKECSLIMEVIKEAVGTEMFTSVCMKASH